MRIDPATFSFNTPRGFLVLEGVNGAGKSTLGKRIGELISAKGHRVVMTREPGATPIGKEIRSLVLEQKSGKPDSLTEIFLFAADRAEHVAKVISPALSEGKIVLSDRYCYSTVAFQGYGRGLDRGTIEAVNRTAIQGVAPDLVILLDLDPLEGLKRARSRDASAKTGAENDAFEREEIAFHTRLRDGFLEIAQRSPEPFVVVDAALPPEKIFQSVEGILIRWMEKLKR